MEQTLWFAEERPGTDWVRHGCTPKWVLVISNKRIMAIRLRKQRWKNKLTGKTKHDRPAWDIPHSPYGLDVVFFVLGCWLLQAQGLLTISWPWERDIPSRRTVHRMAGRLAKDADDWLIGLRAVISDYVAPRPCEEFLRVGIPPPTGCTRLHRLSVPASQLRDVVWIAKGAVQHFSIPMRDLLGVARRRWQ